VIRDNKEVPSEKSRQHNVKSRGALRKAFQTLQPAPVLELLFLPAL